MIFIKLYGFKCSYCTIARYGYVWNGHIMFIYIYIYIYIYIEHRNLETRKHLRLLSSGTKLFITLSLKVVRRKERDTHSFLFWLFHLPPPPTSRVAPATKATGLASASKQKPTGLLQVFVELGNLHGTSNYVLYWIHEGRLFWFRLPQPDTSVKYSCIVTRLEWGLNRQPPDDCLLRSLGNQRL